MTVGSWQRSLLEATSGSEPSEQSSSSLTTMRPSRAPARRNPELTPSASRSVSPSCTARKGCSLPEPEVPTSTLASKSETSEADPVARIRSPPNPASGS